MPAPATASIRSNITKANEIRRKIAARGGPPPQHAARYSSACRTIDDAAKTIDAAGDGLGLVWFGWLAAAVVAALASIKATEIITGTAAQAGSTITAIKQQIEDGAKLFKWSAIGLFLFWGFNRATAGRAK